MKIKRPELLHHSRELRSNLTDAEKLLWWHLRMRQITGFKFRRQHPVGEYIVDLVCLEAALIIEVDGGQHSSALEYDERRSPGLQKEVFGCSGFGITKF